jgi:hypothetical protein
MKIIELPTTFQTPPDIVIPSRDVYGVLHGSSYTPWTDPATMNYATRASFSGVKVHRVHVARSPDQTRAIAAFNFNPYVIDIRELYPVYSPSAYNQAKLKGVRTTQSAIATFQIVLTLVLPPDHRLHYHVVTIKDETDQPVSEGSKRQQRLQRILEERGWTEEKLRGDLFTKRAYGNHMLMKTWSGHANIWRQHAEAEIFADRLKSHTIRGVLMDIVNRHARHLGMSTAYAFELFAAAVSFGMLRLDHAEYLRVDRPLYLQREMP